MTKTSRPLSETLHLALSKLPSILFIICLLLAKSRPLVWLQTISVPQALEVILATTGNLFPRRPLNPHWYWYQMSYRQSLARMNAPMIGDHCEWSPKTAPWWIRMHAVRSSFQNCCL
ncbi:hypothetical protein BS47DRAFT_596346 [Hydnum rufescens UP504]|uniref:Uncharacterized protein n=1 Tax=Hydnum rufescens UP504 TaxID=1448309 RepID=A0A9P6AG04_9AGAM|nr:hypothetical protein BS47DRAFT_596346 [Hydnum rufescens UP504]